MSEVSSEWKPDTLYGMSEFYVTEPAPKTIQITLYDRNDRQERRVREVWTYRWEKTERLVQDDG